MLDKKNALLKDSLFCELSYCILRIFIHSFVEPTYYRWFLAVIPFLFQTPLFPVEVRRLLMCVSLIAATIVTVVSIHEIFQGGVGKNGSSVAVCFITY